MFNLVHKLKKPKYQYPTSMLKLTYPSTLFRTNVGRLPKNGNLKPMVGKGVWSQLSKKIKMMSFDI